MTEMVLNLKHFLPGGIDHCCTVKMLTTYSSSEVWGWIKRFFKYWQV